MKTIHTTLFLTLGCCLTAHAGVIYQISLNTTPLVGNAAGPFSLDFQLIGDQGATAVLNNFEFGSGSGHGTGVCSGACAGDLYGSVTLQSPAGGFFNEFYQTFTPGSTLMFQLEFQNITPPSSGAPDGFSFAILDSSLIEIPMAGGNRSFLTITLDNRSQPSVQTFANDPGGFPAIGAIGAPSVEAPVTIPEPNSLALLVAGILVAAFRCGAVRGAKASPARILRKRLKLVNAVRQSG